MRASELLLNFFYAFATLPLNLKVSTPKETVRQQGKDGGGSSETSECKNKLPTFFAKFVKATPDA